MRQCKRMKTNDLFGLAELFIWVFVILVCSIALSEEVVYYPVKSVTDYKEKSKYAEILSKTKRKVTGYSRSTNAHETTHMIHAELRMKNNSSGHHNSFYIVNTGAIDFPEPKIKKNDVAKYIPQALRGSRYSTYITKAQVWNDQPLYLVDEWIAYLNGAEVAIEEVETGRYRGRRYCEGPGVVEFSVYCTALCMAIKDLDKSYWYNENIRFKLFVIEQLKRSKEIFEKGTSMRCFQGRKQYKYLETWKTSKECQPLKQFIHQELDKAWAI